MTWIILLVCLLLSTLTVTAQSAVNLIIFNANVRTMATAQPKAEAIAVSGGEIVAVGSNKTILAFADEKTEKIDAGGKLVLPGFNDAHVHFASIGNIFSSIKLSDIKTPTQLKDRIAEFARFLPKGRWILGSGWDNRGWVPNDPPTRTLIDQISPDNPVFIYNWDANAVLVNANALQIAGIGASTKAPPGGTLFRDANGDPNGILRGTAIELLKKYVPADHMKKWPEIIETASNYAASFGVTSVQDTHSDDIGPIVLALTNSGKLRTRVYDCVSLMEWKKLADQRVRAASGNAMIRRGCVKYFAEDDDADLLQIQSSIAGADKAGLQVAMHAIGSKPITEVLSLFESVTKANGERDRRFRIEHASRAAAADMSRFAKLNVIASMQPWLFFGANGNGSDDYSQIFELGAAVAFGSDASISDLNPLYGIHAAVNSRNGVSVEQAVRAYTVGSAYAEFQEKVKGSIEVGKLADFVILSEDIFAIPKAKIRDVTVRTTILNGKVVFKGN